MRRLGYDRYGAQGGDFGSMISLELGRVAPGRVVGVHSSMLLVPPPDDPAELAGLSEPERRRLEQHARFENELSGHFRLLAARPQTPAYALTDSPVGQLAWIMDKFWEWTEGDVPEDAVDRDHLLTNVMIYWLTGTASSSAQFYYEYARELLATPQPGSGRSPFRWGWPSSLTTWSCPSAGSPTATSRRSSTGASSTGAGISPHWSSPRRSSRTCGPSSGSSGPSGPAWTHPRTSFRNPGDVPRYRADPC